MDLDIFRRGREDRGKRTQPTFAQEFGYKAETPETVDGEVLAFDTRLAEQECAYATASDQDTLY